jgi:hypothetical protein
VGSTSGRSAIVLAALSVNDDVPDELREQHEPSRHVRERKEQELLVLRAEVHARAPDLGGEGVVSITLGAARARGT